MIEKIDVFGDVKTQCTSVNFFEFSGGEVHIELPDLRLGNSTSVTITTRIESSSALIELLMVTDAVRRQRRDIPIDVIIPYLPYARQDKISVHGESLSLKVFADIINLQKYRRIVSYDVHSEVSAAVIPNLKVVPQRSILAYAVTVPSIKRELYGKVLVVPDYGASKKACSVREVLGATAIVQADKNRDAQGKITGVRVAFTDGIEGRDVVIVDDIVDGGATFIALTEVIKANACGNVTLFATHGIFSKGTECLKNAGIDAIITTDTFTPRNSEGVIYLPIVGRVL